MERLATLLSYREGNRLEAKGAQGGLPRSVWETYSAFANTDGGVILLGVKETASRELFPVGLPDAEKMRKEFWDAVNNKDVVSANLLSSSDVLIEDVEGLSVLVIEVPRASREDRPVYIRRDMLAGSYRRNGEGDYHCSEDEVKAMLRDSGTGVSDRAVVENASLESLCEKTVEDYRRELAAIRRGHPWIRMSNEELLMRLGAVDRASDGFLHPTRAGLLMFGYEYEITREFPFYFLEYREVLGDNRWDDRFTTSEGDWSGNVFDFWHRAAPRLTADIRRPFALGADLKRVDDTPLHKALREALANALVHADYQARTSTVITRRNDFVKFANAGTLLLPKEVAMSGGLSETRNPTLMKMFNLLAIGEKAGSGFDAMRQGCRWAGLPDPVLEEELAPDRVILSVQTCGEQTRKRVAFAALESDAFGGDFETVDLSNAEAVLMRMSYTGSIKRKDVEDLLLVSSATAKNILADLVRQGKVLKEGKGRSTRYRLPKS